MSPYNVRRNLNDLLAIIHRDGGHYTSKHGLKKSIKKAIDLSSQRIASIDAVLDAFDMEADYE